MNSYTNLLHTPKLHLVKYYSIFTDSNEDRFFHAFTTSENQVIDPAPLRTLLSSLSEWVGELIETLDTNPNLYDVLGYDYVQLESLLYMLYFHHDYEMLKDWLELIVQRAFEKNILKPL